MNYERRQPDPDLAAELRQTAGQEWSEEAAEDERLTELLRRRRMTLSDRGKELLNRGDRVSAEFDGHSFSGAVVSGGDDYVTVEGPGQVADIRLSRARWSVLPAEQPLETKQDGAETFRALLHERSASAETVRLALPDGDMVIGQLEVIAKDHVEMNDVDGRRLIVPTKMILAVVRSTDFH